MRKNSPKTAALDFLQKYWLILLILTIIFSYLFARFFYNNVIVPWPYRRQLQACLNQANHQSSGEKIKEARYKCFRTYPHFL